MASEGTRVRVGERQIKVSNLDKVLYPATGTTKADVMRYYLAVAGVLIPQAQGRPVTRKRWPEGVEKQSFFRKDLEDTAPSFIPTAEIKHKTSVNEYPLITEPATLAWLAQVAALELHTPQWRFGADGEPANPDRLVLDLDPGPGVGLEQTAEVALWCREIIEGMGLTAVPVTSGSKGIHIYAGLDEQSDAAAVSKVARALADALEAEHPDRVTATMKKSERGGKVFLDWSQNNGKKTTICPYSLRGRERPTVAAPRTWDELEQGGLKHLEFGEVMERVADGLDPIAALGATAQGAAPAALPGAASAPDRLATYRSMRDKSKTGEPVPDEAPAPREGETIFVIGEHHASHLHWDFRLEHDGVLVSWAVPKGPPLDAAENRLAVQTEDHPIEYAQFEGTIPKGQYGAGTVKIWDIGTCEIEKWREDEIIAVLHGRAGGGLGGTARRYALIRTEGDNWLLKFMKRQPAAAGPSGAADRASSPAPASARQTSGSPAPAAPPAPMLPTAATRADIALEKRDGTAFAYEMKWDGYRIVADIRAGRVRLFSRAGKDYTSLFPHAPELGLLLDDATLDGELIAIGEDGRPSFSLLHAADPRSPGRRSADRAAETEDGTDETEQSAAIPEVGDAPELRYMAFDLLRLGDRDLTGEPYETRRGLLERLGEEGDEPSGEPGKVSDRAAERLAAASHVSIPPAFSGSFEAAWRAAEEMGLEGVVAKQKSSPYLAGERSRRWLKLKRELHQEVVVIGVRRGKRGIASLLVAVPDEEGELRYAGRVGTGFSAAQLDDIEARLRRIERKTPAVEVPAEDTKDAWWVTPKQVAEVALTGATGGGKVRHASWRGWRDDKSPRDVRWEV